MNDEMKDIMLAIRAAVEMNSAKLDGVELRLSSLEGLVKGLEDQQKETNFRLTALEEHQQETNLRLTALEEHQQETNLRLTALEEYQQETNLRLTALETGQKETRFEIRELKWTMEGTTKALNETMDKVNEIESKFESNR